MIDLKFPSGYGRVRKWIFFSRDDTRGPFFPRYPRGVLYRVYRTGYRVQTESPKIFRLFRSGKMAHNACGPAYTVEQELESRGSRPRWWMTLHFLTSWATLGHKFITLLEQFLRRPWTSNVATYNFGRVDQENMMYLSERKQIHLLRTRSFSLEQIDQRNTE